ncbi:complex I intermediate-associated protein 30 isoform X1 [Nomia melanderi]|uniref:complex I intermediate-associated protein 30 isoform X1 n=1 Tax=Nomia melanderi TaxID=2448451 RepID=UPI003FCD0EE9
MFRILQSHLRILNNRGFHNSSRCLKDLNVLQKFQEGYNNIKAESLMFLKDMRESMSVNKNIVPPDVVDIILKFDGTAKCRDQWVLNCDRDHSGYSTAKLDFSSTGTGLFHGHLSTRIIKDGAITSSGFCNITTVPKRKAFQVRDYYDFEYYNCLVLRLRGDGRCYMINLLHDTYFNQPNKSDAHHYVMYTSGGPYWQDIKIPFSKFVYAVNGVAQPKQQSLNLYTIERIGITLGDNKNGPFKLEIDYIGVCNDASIFETCAYEPEDMSANA